MVPLRRRPLPVVLVAALACAGGAAAAADEQVFGPEDWQRAIAAMPLDPGEVVYPFAATDEMAEWARQKTAVYAAASPEVRLQALQLAFFDKGEFEFEYEQARTLTAEEAFAARHGNCMSFTSLFIALGRSLGYPVVMVTVERQPEVEREGSLVVVNRHVVAGFRSPQRLYTYDFYVSTETPVSSRRVLDDVFASAVYHTNIGGHAIRVENLEEAVRNLRIATTLAPAWAPAWVNLGVAQSRLGDTDAAFEAFHRALEEEPGNSSALVNLARLYREQGREEEAENAIRAAAEGTRNPFTLITLADAEMTRGNYGKALQHLRRARWWYGREPHVYEALARLANAQGEPDKAARYRDRAAELRAEQAAPPAPPQ